MNTVNLIKLKYKVKAIPNLRDVIAYVPLLVPPVYNSLTPLQNERVERN